MPLSRLVTISQVRQTCLDAVEEALLQPQGIEDVVDVAVGQGENRRVLVAVDAEDLGLDVRARPS